jgi:transposase
MTLGLAERQGGLFNVAVQRCEAELPERSIYRLLHAERDRLFPDELFADLYIQHGRRSVPPSILAVVMVLQRLEGCSDREACDRFAYDLRWRYAAGVDDETPGFVHTVLVELRARLRASADPDRIFRVTTELARQAGLVECGGCWIRRRCMTRSPPRTRSRCCAARSVGCCGPVQPSWPRRCGRRWPAMTTTPPRASRSATGTTQPPVSSWWTPCFGMATGPGYAARPAARPGGRPGGGAAGHRDRPRHRGDRRRPLHHRPGVAPDRVISVVDPRPATGTRPVRAA